MPISMTRNGVGVSRDPVDSEWDAFLEVTRGGSHQQSSKWSRVKAVQGFETVRLVLRRSGAIVGGCQVLLRRIPRVGAVAYIPRGPVLPDRDADALDKLLDALGDLAERERILYLKLQPPVERFDMVALLEARGFVASRVLTAYTSTVRLDLERSEPELLAAMRTTTRKHIRRGERRGTTIRSGDERDIPTLVRIIQETGDRQRFSSYPRRYYERMWSTFAATGHARLFVAEHDGIALSASLLIVHGESAHYKAGGWSGTGAELFPNELMHWAGIRWARDNGLRWYDFEGVDDAAAQSFLAGRTPPRSTPHQRVAYFKLGFGGEVSVHPGTYDRIYGPIPPTALRWAMPVLDRSELPLRLANRILRHPGRRPSSS
jgi:lipid II:glycine glycyltransferase (peptidoglycan interpeptide bridge formation enzyme)